MRKEKPAEYYTGKGYLSKSRHKFTPLYMRIIDLLPEPSAASMIVDFGCGVGYFAGRLLKLRYPNYIGIDFSQDMIDIASERVPEYEYVLMSLYSEELEQFIKDYRIFTIIETLEHMENDINVLNKIPSGSLIVGSVPRADSLAHVRTFSGVNSVVDRYGSIIKFNYIYQAKVNTNKLQGGVTIFRGIKK